MKIKELIEILSKEDPELMVLVNGYEDGYDEIYIRRGQVVENYEACEWNGKYYDVYPLEEINAVILSRY